MTKQKPIRIVPIADKLSLTVEEAGLLTGFGASTLREEVRAGKLIAHKHRSRTTILRADLERWLESLERLRPDEVHPASVP